MKIPELIEEVLALPVDDRWMVVYAVLSSIEANKAQDIPVYSWQLAEIEEAEKELEEGKVEAISLEKFKLNVQERIEQWQKNKS